MNGHGVLTVVCMKDRGITVLYIALAVTRVRTFLEALIMNIYDSVRGASKKKIVDHWSPLTMRVAGDGQEDLVLVQ